MRTHKIYALSAVLMLTVSGTALAQDPAASGSMGGGGGARGLGLGFATMIVGTSPGTMPTGLSGASLAYDWGQFHIDTILFFQDRGGPASTEFGVGGRFWWHLHTASAADFSLGAGFGYATQDPPGPGDSQMVIIEAGAQIRAFLVSNVAVSAGLGINVLSADAEGFLLSAVPVGLLGLHYYF